MTEWLKKKKTNPSSPQSDWFAPHSSASAVPSTPASWRRSPLIQVLVQMFLLWIFLWLYCPNSSRSHLGFEWPALSGFLLWLMLQEYLVFPLEGQQTLETGLLSTSPCVFRILTVSVNWNKDVSSFLLSTIILSKQEDILINKVISLSESSLDQKKKKTWEQSCKFRDTSFTVQPIGKISIRLQTNGISMFLQFSSVAQSCPPLCNPLDCSMPGLSIHHQLNAS